MGNYTKIVDYAAKDLLLTGDPAKAGKGAEIGAEFDAIAAMSATKAELAGSASQAFSTRLLKVGPEAAMPWPSTWRMVDAGNETAMGEDHLGQTIILNNAYTTDGTNYLYRVTGAATRTVWKNDGSVEYSSAPSAGGVGTAATFTVRFSISNTGVMKVGPEATPAWPSTWRAIDLGNQSSFYGNPFGQTGVLNNAYNDGTNWRARVSGPASLHQVENGEFIIYTAPSVAAGAVLAFTPRLVVANTGVATVNGNVVRHDGNIFHGRVNADGTAARLPAGWTSSRSSMGVYVVTHNLGSSSLSVVGTSSAPHYSVSGGFLTGSQIVVRSSDAAGAFVDSSISFILMLD